MNIYEECKREQNSFGPKNEAILRVQKEKFPLMKQKSSLASITIIYSNNLMEPYIGPGISF